MVHTQSYVPKTNLFGLDIRLFERYFGVKAVGDEEPGSGELARSLSALITLVSTQLCM